MKISQTTRPRALATVETQSERPLNSLAIINLALPIVDVTEERMPLESSWAYH